MDRITYPPMSFYQMSVSFKVLKLKLINTRMLLHLFWARQFSSRLEQDSAKVI